MRVKPVEEIIRISLPQIELEGELIVPLNAKGIVLFSHGSGSSRFSPRNQFVARFLQEKCLGTLLIDLLTAEEEDIDRVTRTIRFDIELLVNRLLGITQWIFKDDRTQSYPIGYFGSSTGAAVALISAAKMGKKVSAIVSRGGRVDLAGPFISQVQSPSLLIVGGDDTRVIELNQEAYGYLKGVKKLEIITGANHLFEEPGALEKVADLSGQWFLKYLQNQS